MAARVVLHAQVLDPFLLAVKSALQKRGVAVVQDDSFDPQDLHIVTGPGKTGNNIAEVVALLVAPYRAVMHPALRQTFQADAVPYGVAKTFLEDLRADHANGKRYAVTDLPEGMIAVCIGSDDTDPAHIATTHRMIADALRGTRPVVVVAADPMDSGRLAHFIDHHPGAMIYHDLLADLLHKTDVVVSRAGAGVILAHIHRKPAILYTGAPFDHISPVVADDLPFEAALAKALATQGVYAKYLYWYFQTQALRADAPDFADRLLDICAAMGFGAARLGAEVTAGFARTLASTHDAAQTLTAFLSAQPAIRAVRLTKTLKISDQSWVFQARINGDKVVVKRFFDADPAHTVRSLQGELALLEIAMGQGRYRANRCLFAWPDDATVVLSHAGGIRMVDAIAAVSGAERAALLRDAGAWLNTYATPRHRVTSFGPMFWVKELDARPRHKLRTDAVALFDAGLAGLSRLTQETMGVRVVQAATHGDYAGINVHYDDGLVIGVDIQGECWQALAKDAAQFLVWQALFDPRDTGARSFGIDRADLDAFLSGLPMLADEHATTLPFFIGWKMMHRLLDKADRDADPAPELALLGAYLADLDVALEKQGPAGLSGR